MIYGVMAVRILTTGGVTPRQSVKDALDRFTRQTPVRVMVRATVENVLAAQRQGAILTCFACTGRPTSRYYGSCDYPMLCL